MSQNSDDSIERFFRKGVVQQDKTFMERDWQRMEKMLDEQAMATASARAGKIRTATRIGAALSLISFVFLIGVENNTSRNIVQMQAAVGVLGPRIEGVEVKTENPTADLHSSTVNEKFKVSTTREEPAALPRVKKTLRSPAQPAKRKTYLSNAKQVSSENGEINAHPTIESSNSEAETNNQSVLERESRVVESVQSHAQLAEPVSEILSEEENNLLSLVKADTQVSNENKVEDAKPSVKTPSKFNLTALVSPDFSTTKLSRYSKPSGVFGVLIGYRVTNRFTVMVGATKSLKRYEGYGQEYSPPEGYWQNRTNGVVPDEVEGQCGILEIPLMVQFDVLQKAKSRLFVSGGVSSYFMRSEHYDYTFHEPNPGAADSWTAKEPSNYLFKIGHLSAGYDRLIGKNFTIGIEPFLKMPFEGIGWTDINLYSTGAYINLRYNILRIPQD